MGAPERRPLRQAASVVEMRGQYLELKIDKRLQEARFDEASLAGYAAPHQSRENPLSGGGAGQHVTDGEPEGNRPLPFVAVQPHDARARLRQEILAGALHPGPLLAITADRGIDDARIDGPDRLVVQPQPFDDARPEVLDHNVGLREKPLQRSEIGLVLEVYRKAFLGAVDRMENRRVAADLGVAQIKPAGKIAAIRPLDLDDPRAEIHQPQRTIGAGEKLAHIDDDQAGKRQFGFCCHAYLLFPHAAATGCGRHPLGPNEAIIFLFEYLIHI